MSKQQPIETVTFTATLTALRRKPIVGDESQQRAWDMLWTARLRIFCEVFPWLRPEIRELREVPEETPVGEAGEHQRNLGVIQAHKLYECGDRATQLKDQVSAIHDRQNKEWFELTGLPALGSVEDWRAAAAAAGVAPAEFEKRDFGQLAKFITAWALAKRANQSRDVTTEADKPVLLDDFDLGILKYLNESPSVAKAQEDIASGANIGRKVVGERLNKLREAGYVARPTGKKSKDAITPKGIERYIKSDAKVTQN